MKIFIITNLYDKEEVLTYSKKLEDEGHTVFSSIRDVNKTLRPIEAKRQIMENLYDANEVHVFYNSNLNVQFELGAAFAIGKRIKLIQLENSPFNKYMATMLTEWETNSNSINHWGFFEFIDEVKKAKQI